MFWLETIFQLVLVLNKRFEVGFYFFLRFSTLIIPKAKGPLSDKYISLDFETTYDYALKVFVKELFFFLPTILMFSTF